MKAIALTAYFAATFLCALGADKSFIPKWTHVLSSSAFNGNQPQSRASRATCDIQRFKSCMLTLCDNIDLFPTYLPYGDNFDQQFSYVIAQSPPQGFKDACSYLANLTQCAQTSDCFTQASMNQLDFPDGEHGSMTVLSIILSYQYMCTNDYQTAVKNWQCINNVLDEDNPCISSDSNNNRCKQAEQELTCTAKFFNQKCNNDVGKMFCQAAGAAIKVISQGSCSSNDIDNACNVSGSTNDLNAGSQNDHFYSIVLALFIALVLSSRKHA